MEYRKDPVAVAKRYVLTYEIDPVPRIFGTAYVKTEPNPAAALSTSSTPRCAHMVPCAEKARALDLLLRFEPTCRYHRDAGSGSSCKWLFN